MLREKEVKLIVPELDKALAKLRASGILKRKPESTKKDQFSGSLPSDTNEANPHYKLVNEVDFLPCLFSRIIINFKCILDRCTEIPYCFDIVLESFQAASWYSP